MSFSLYHMEGARPVALINWPESKLHLNVVYASNKAKEPEVKRDEKSDKDIIREAERKLIGHQGRAPFSVLGTDYFKKGDHGKNMRKGDLAIMASALNEGEENFDNYPELDQRPAVKNYMQQKLDDARMELLTRMTEFEIGGKLEPCIDPSESERIGVYGPSKAGKSTWCTAFIKCFHRVHPDWPIFILCVHDNDKAFDDIREFCTFETIDEDFVAKVNSGMGEKVSDCLVLFDDVDSKQDEKLLKATQRLRGTLLEVGRKKNVTVLCTSHQYREGKQTKKLNMELTSFVIFPQEGEYYYLRDYLKTYGGMTPKQIDRLLSTKAKWIWISRQSPSFIIHEKGGFHRTSNSLEPNLGKRRRSLFGYEPERDQQTEPEYNG